VDRRDCNGSGQGESNLCHLILSIRSRIRSKQEEVLWEEMSTLWKEFEGINEHCVLDFVQYLSMFGSRFCLVETG